MSSAKITLLGFYNYNNALFDEMVLPDGVDKETLVDTILMRGAEYECIYSDPGFMQKLIGSWSRQWRKVFEKWQDVTNTDFAPLENYDRYEDWSDTKQSNEKSVGIDRTNTTGRDDVTRSNVGSHSDTNSTTTTNSTTNTNTVSGSGSTSGSDTTAGSGSTDDTKTISAYNSNNFVNADKDVQSNSTSTESTTSTTSSSQSSANETSNENGTSRENGSSNDRTDETTNANKLLNSTSNNETTRDYNDVSVHTSRIHGNVGVTTSSAMYREFYELMLQYGNIYNSIATVFLQAFVIPIL